MRQQAVYVASLMLVLVFAAAPVLAGVPSVPEIDGGSLSTGLGILAGSLLMLRARFRRR